MLICLQVRLQSIIVAGKITAIQQHMKEAADAHYRFHLSNFLAHTMLSMKLLFQTTVHVPI